MMDIAFQYCVDVIKKLSLITGLTYQEINIYLFVIIHPLITLYFFILYRKYKTMYMRMCNKRGN